MAFLDVPGAFLLDDDGYLLGGSVVGLKLERGRMSLKIALKFT